ncbi:MAG: 2-deoxystreptamine N-acetyl-D-glucosaminyltransferase [Microgenomates bacterium OLB22]|nr:MAG: 2-deoxystreptamine N-acetyl-D-glucosaminyltransferase [Microgenomates bacterium OLB22]
MPHEYHKHDLLLHLARSDEKTAEQFGMAVAEAMACGLPVIAYDTGALKEVIGDAGICIPQGSVDAVTRALHLFISDSIAYRKLSGNAVARATKEFDSIKQSNKLLSLYRSLQ